MNRMRNFLLFTAINYCGRLCGRIFSCLNFPPHRFISTQTAFLPFLVSFLIFKHINDLLLSLEMEGEKCGGVLLTF